MARWRMPITYRFSSKEWNAQAGLYYYLYRCYDPNLQRWTNKDPIEELGGINLYNAFQNNPICYIDSNGNFSLVEGIALTVIVTVASAVIVDVAIHLQTSAKRVSIEEIINDTYHDTGKCCGMTTRDVVATIEQKPVDVATQGFSLAVSQLTIQWCKICDTGR